MRICFLVTALMVMGAAGPLGADVLYRVTDLGNLGGFMAYGTGVNQLGQVTGYADLAVNGTDFGARAFLYTDGQMQNLGTLVGGYATFAFAINNLGQVSGEARTPAGDLRAFLYTNGQIQDLGSLSTLVGGFNAGAALNDLGQVTGSSGSHAFLYSNGRLQDLGTLGGSGVLSISSGSGINNLGQITGYANTSAGLNHAFLYTNGRMQDLGTLGGLTSSGAGINSVGQIAGTAQTSSGAYHAFLYTNGQMLDLGTLPGGAYSEAYALNDSGQVVGNAGASTLYVQHAFLYSNGQMLDLNNLIDPALGITLTDATAINDSGEIVADGGNHAYLLTPVPEPGTWALVVVAGLGLMVGSGLHDAANRPRSHE